jgi:hypothetical protein
MTRALQSTAPGMASTDAARAPTELLAALVDEIPARWLREIERV